MMAVMMMMRRSKGAILSLRQNSGQKAREECKAAASSCALCADLNSVRASGPGVARCGRAALSRLVGTRGSPYSAATLTLV